jgi:bla regulator protein blaR1
MAPLLLECALRATLMAAGTAAVLWAMRIRSAAARHAAWTVVLLGMLVLPIWSAAGPRVSLRWLGPTAPPAGIVAEPTPDLPPPAVLSETSPQDAPANRTPARVDVQDVLIGMYLVGVSVLLARLAIGTVQAHRLRRRAAPHAGRATSDLCAAPITVGWFAPVLILPAAWPRWPRAQLEAVLTHEAEHARRHDPLVQWLALVNRAVFCFHPLAWWLERRLAILAEEACDAAVLAAGHSPQDYSEYLLDLARSVTREGRRVNVVGMAMPGSGLTKRMRQILDGRPAQSISRSRLAVTVALCATSSVVFAGATLAPRAASDGPQDSAAVSAAAPRFEVVSIKPCKDGDLPFDGRGGGAGPSRPSPGRLHLDCVTLTGGKGLIRRAYGVFADGRLRRHWTALQVEGGPAWASSDRYTIDAKAEGQPSAEMMSGPMMQALLEDRFQLKVHRETRDVPVYELTVAKGASRLRPFDRRCKPVDFTKGDLPAQLEATGACRIAMYGSVVEAPGQTLDDFIKFVLTVLDRPVIDKTGLTGRYDIHLDLPPSDPSGLPDITSAFAVAMQQQLGLKLVPAKGPGEFLIVDHLGRPLTDGAAPAAPRAIPAVPTTQLAFDVASIKPGNDKVPAATRTTPSGISYTSVTLRTLIADAYGVKALSMSSPDTHARGVLDDRQRYDVVAKADRAVSRLEIQQMLKTFLAERFKLVLHHDTRTESVYRLSALPAGSKLQPSTGDGEPACGPAPDGGAVCQDMTMASFSDYLTSHLNRVVVDGTGLAGRYDFTLKLDGTPGYNQLKEAISSSADPGAAKAAVAAAMNDWSSSSIFADIQKQLGLKLNADKAPVDNLVIDRVERPSPNSGGELPASAASGARK